MNSGLQECSFEDSVLPKALRTLTNSETAGPLDWSISPDASMTPKLADLGSVPAGSLTGITITGSLIRTAASGQRVEINSTDGLKGVDSGGNVVTQIDTHGILHALYLNDLAGYNSISLTTAYQIQFQYAGNTGIIIKPSVGQIISTNPASGGAGDLNLVPAPGYNVSFGSYSALGSETLQGYITVKDANGNLRKLAVIA